MNQRKRQRFLIKLKLIKMALNAFLPDKKSLFMDCGSNVGQGYTFFKRYMRPSAFDAIMIEPNPNCMQVVQQKFSHYKHITFLEAAAWVRNEKLKLFGLVESQEGATSTGASVVSNHNSGSYESKADEALEVDAISLAELIEEKAKDYNNIVIKLDIESSEYEVLQDLLDKKVTGKIAHMFIEFHSRYFDESEQEHYRQWEAKLIKELEQTGVGVTLWF